MITSNDIKGILKADFEAVFGVSGNIDINPPQHERMVTEQFVIVMPAGVDNGQLERCFPRVCFYVPKVLDLYGDGQEYYTSNNDRLNEIEGLIINHCRSAVYGKKGEHTYLYRIEEMTQEDDIDTWSNFINARIRFEVVNTKL